MPDPTWADADPAFRALVEAVEWAGASVSEGMYGGIEKQHTARLALHRWHREEVAKAEAAAIDAGMTVVKRAYISAMLRVGLPEETNMAVQRVAVEIVGEWLARPSAPRPAEQGDGDAPTPRPSPDTEGGNG